jgi:hypothetical protein
MLSDKLGRHETISGRIGTFFRHADWPAADPDLYRSKAGFVALHIQGRDMSAETVAGYLRNELYGGRDDNFRWEDFEQIKIRDPYLEGIRKQAIAVRWPLNDADRQTLEVLLRQLSPQSN